MRNHLVNVCSSATLRSRGKTLAALSATLAILNTNAPAFAGVEILPASGRNVYRLAVGRLGEEHQIIGST